ncbi:ankyrin repeat domain-containing protein [Paenibacillus taichungensis]|uniref:ankyrin repeat domain-containing protein n=1 Tax=Paenibacillus taichungensis TaxID=484184 RepID=UPI0039A702F4
MFKIGNQGTFETLPDHAKAIYKGDVIAVEEFIKQGMDLEKEITLSKYIALTPLDIALITNQQAVVKLLVDNGVNLNVKDNPAILKAVRYGGEEIIRYLHQKGAKLSGLSKVKSNAYDEAYYGNKKNIAVLKDLGLDIRKYGGETLRKAVSNHDMKMVQYLLDEGVDVTIQEKDGERAYTIAVSQKNTEMAEYLKSS